MTNVVTSAVTLPRSSPKPLSLEYREQITSLISSSRDGDGVADLTGTVARKLYAQLELLSYTIEHGGPAERRDAEIALGRFYQFATRTLFELRENDRLVALSEDVAPLLERGGALAQVQLKVFNAMLALMGDDFEAAKSYLFPSDISLPRMLMDHRLGNQERDKAAIREVLSDYSAMLGIFVEQYSRDGAIPMLTLLAQHGGELIVLVRRLGLEHLGIAAGGHLASGLFKIDSLPDSELEFPQRIPGATGPVHDLRRGIQQWSSLAAVPQSILIHCYQRLAGYLGIRNRFSAAEKLLQQGLNLAKQEDIAQQAFLQRADLTLDLLQCLASKGVTNREALQFTDLPDLLKEDLTAVVRGVRASMSVAEQLYFNLKFSLTAPAVAGKFIASVMVHDQIAHALADRHCSEVPPQIMEYLNVTLFRAPTEIRSLAEMLDRRLKVRDEEEGADLLNYCLVNLITTALEGFHRTHREARETKIALCRILSRRSSKSEGDLYCRFFSAVVVMDDQIWSSARVPSEVVAARLAAIDQLRRDGEMGLGEAAQVLTDILKVQVLLKSSTFDRSLWQKIYTLADRANKHIETLILDQGPHTADKDFQQTTLWKKLAAVCVVAADKGGMPRCAERQLSRLKEFDQHSFFDDAGPVTKIALVTRISRLIERDKLGLLSPRCLDPLRFEKSQFDDMDENSNEDPDAEQL